MCLQGESEKKTPGKKIPQLNYSITYLSDKNNKKYIHHHNNIMLYYILNIIVSQPVNSNENKNNKKYI